MLRSHRRKVLYALIKEFVRVFGRELDGRKKLQKLMFLVEHWDLETGKITKSSGLTGYTFKIWLYGPFCPEINRDLVELAERGIIEEEVYRYYEGSQLPKEKELPPLSTYIDDGEPRTFYFYRIREDIEIEGLDKEVLKKISVVVKTFGKMSPLDLELRVCGMLGLTPLKKMLNWGKTIDEYLSHIGETS